VVSIPDPNAILVRSSIEGRNEEFAKVVLVACRILIPCAPGPYMIDMDIFVTKYCVLSYTIRRAARGPKQLQSMSIQHENKYRF
jgi:hypothetical protein